MKRGSSSVQEGESSKKRKINNSSDSSTEEDIKKKKHKKVHKKKRRHSSSGSDSDHKKNKVKKKKKHKKEKKVKKKEKKLVEVGPPVPEKVLNNSKNMAPMTKEEWEKKQSVIKKVYDPVSGRNRLIKGDGEVLEEIVSKDRHKQINKQATIGDGNFFQANLPSKHS